MDLKAEKTNFDEGRIIMGEPMPDSKWVQTPPTEEPHKAANRNSASGRSKKLKALTYHCFEGGFVGTVLMTLFLHGISLFGLPLYDIPGMLASLVVGGPVYSNTAAWWWGLAAHFVVGTILYPVLYAVLIHPFTEAYNWRLGAGWGAILWLAAMVAKMPIVGLGLFASRTENPFLVMLVSLVGYLLYGGMFGQIARNREQRADVIGMHGIRRTGRTA